MVLDFRRAANLTGGLLLFACTLFPGLRGFMAWSINWDNFQNASGFAIANRAYLNTLP